MMNVWLASTRMKSAAPSSFVLSMEDREVVEIGPKPKDFGFLPFGAAGQIPALHTALISEPQYFWFVGLGTALLPCGALAAAVLIAASMGSTMLGSLSMLAFAVVSGVGLVAATWVFERFARRPKPGTARVLAAVLALGAILFVIRPVHALRTGDASSCHAPAGDTQDHEALHHHSHSP